MAEPSSSHEYVDRHGKTWTYRPRPRDSFTRGPATQDGGNYAHWYVTEHWGPMTPAAVAAERDNALAEVARLREERDDWKAGCERALRDREAVEAEMDSRLIAAWTERDALAARLERAEAALAEVRELHKPMLMVVQWWDDQTGKGEALVCPICCLTENETNEWDLPVGAYGVKPEGWIDPYFLSPCPTLAAVDTYRAATPSTPEGE